MGPHWMSLWRHSTPFWQPDAHSGPPPRPPQMGGLGGPGPPLEWAGSLKQAEGGSQVTGAGASLQPTASTDVSGDVDSSWPAATLSPCCVKDIYSTSTSVDASWPSTSNSSSRGDASRAVDSFCTSAALGAEDASSSSSSSNVSSNWNLSGGGG